MVRPLDLLQRAVHDPARRQRHECGALSSIGKATHAGPSQLQWVVSGYTLAFGLVPVLAGRLGDDHGRRRMFQIGVVTFALTSALAGLSPTAAVPDRGPGAARPRRAD